MNGARYAVWFRHVPIAWFVVEDDARDFISSQPSPTRFEVKPI